MTTLCSDLPHGQRRQRKVLNQEGLGYRLSQLDWSAIFNNCTDGDSYAHVLTTTLMEAIAACTSYKPASKRPRLPRHVVKLLHKKNELWRKAKQSGNYSKYKAAKATARAAIRRHRRNQETRITYSNNRHLFFDYVNNKVHQHSPSISLVVGGSIVNDSTAAELFKHEFSKNFSAVSSSTCLNASHSTLSRFQLNCNERLVAAAIASCSNSNCSPDGISYKLLKMYSHLLVRPLNIVFQQSLFTGCFPAAWKHAIVIPLYKGRGDRSSTASYRPISLCSCIGKVLERVVQVQLVDYLNHNSLLSPAQHGFTSGRSTVTNLICTDKAIADCVLAGHACDVISFDFKAAFDKAPHSCVLEGAS
jgi:hypothetical protein